jgi:PAS domain S-box-containing protein
MKLERVHSLLKRQLKRHFGDQFHIPAQWQPFVDQVNDAYLEFDSDREMLEHSLELSSQELLDANSQMRAVFEAIPDLVLRLDHQGTILGIKAGSPSDLMIKREDLIGKQVQHVPLEDIARQFSEAIGHVIAKNMPVSIEYSAVLHGQESHYEARLVPLPEKQIAVIIRNVTERKQSLRLLGSAVEQSGESIVISDAQLDWPGARFLFVNPAFTRMTGYTAAEALGQTTRLLQGPKSDRADLRQMRDTLRQGQPYAGETIAYRKDGTEFQMERQVVPIRNSSGTITHFLGIQRDITARKEAEIALRESDEKFHQLAENITDAFWIRSPDMREVHYVSPAFERIWGRSTEGMYANPQQWSDAILPEDRDRVLAAFATLRGAAPSISIEYRIARPDGEVRWVHARGFQVRDAGDKLIRLTGIVTDTTERKRAEVDLEAVHKQLVETSRQAGMAEIATNVLHNVGNILNSVNVSAALVSSTLRTSRARGLTQAVQLMEEHATELADFLTQDEKGKLLPGYLNGTAQALAQEQQRMIEELAHLTQSIDHIKGVVATQQSYAVGSSVIEPVQICELAEDALRMNGDALARHRITVVKQFAQVPVLRLDRARVLQILVNLISNAGNALENMTDQSNQITLTVDSTDGPNLRVSVEDNGDGIPAQNLTRIFAHGFTTRKTGHGFGLHSCALAARQMGGTLTAHSDGPGKGALFTLELPVNSVQATS